MIKLKLAILFSLLSTYCFAQIPVSSEWKSKTIKGDTIVLLKGGVLSDVHASVSRKGPFIDSTYYWTFNRHDSLKLFLVERSSRMVPVKKDSAAWISTADNIPTHGTFSEIPGSKKEARQLKKILKDGGAPSVGSPKSKKHSKNESENLTAYENQQQPDSTEIRLSLWYPSNGTWQQPDSNTLIISQTKSCNGHFSITYIDSDKILLVRINE